MNEMFRTCLPAWQRRGPHPQRGKERSALSQNRVRGQAMPPGRAWCIPVTPHLITPPWYRAKKPSRISLSHVSCRLASRPATHCVPRPCTPPSGLPDSESGLFGAVGRGGNKNQRLSKESPGKARGVVGPGEAPPGTSPEKAVELGDPSGGERG